MEAIVLAGGLGIRLRERVSGIPKVMADINGKPFIYYVLDYLYRNGIKHVVLAVSYMNEKLTNAVGNRYLGMIIDYSVEREPLGTGGAICKAMKQCSEDFIFILNGDTFFDVNLREMYELRKKNKIAVALKYMTDASRYGITEVNNEKIISFKEKQKGTFGYINGGIYLADKSVHFGEKEKFSFEKDFLEKNTDSLIPCDSDGYFIDIGIPEDYDRACTELKDNITPRTGKAVFIDRDGTINVNTGHLYKKEEFVFIHGVPESIAEFRRRDYYIVVISNQAGIAKGMYKQKDVENLNSYISEELKKYCAAIDMFLWCPHHEDGIVAEYSHSCKCRKPKSGMIDIAQSKFACLGIQLDRKNSILIGDMESDILCGRNGNIGTCIMVGESPKQNHEIADVYIKNLDDYFQSGE